MKYTINRTLNGVSILLDNKKQIAPLADYINSTEWQTVEICYHYGSNTGIIIVYHDGIFESDHIEKLKELIKQFCRENHID